MPFDDNLVLLDGTVSITDLLDDPPILTSVDTSTGAKVLDLKETGRNGLVAVLICPADLTAGEDTSTLIAYIQCSDTLNMTGTTTGIERHGSFQVASTSTGTITGVECPCVAFVRFATRKRYVRLNITVSISTNFGAPICLLSPYPFDYL